MPAPTSRVAISAIAAVTLALAGGTSLAQIKVPSKPLTIPGGKPTVDPNAPKTLDPNARPEVNKPALEISRPLTTIPAQQGPIQVVNGTGLAGEWTGQSITRFAGQNATTLDTPSRPKVAVETTAGGFASSTLGTSIAPLSGGYKALMDRYKGAIVLTQSDIALPTALGGDPDVFTATFADGSTKQMLLSGDQLFILEGVLVVPGTVAWSMRNYVRTGLAKQNVAVLPKPVDPKQPLNPVKPVKPIDLNTNRPVNPSVILNPNSVAPNLPVPTPLKASACQELEIVTGLLNMKGGTAMVQLVRGFYVEFGIAFNSQPSEAQCSAALDAMRRAGLDPAATDGGLSAAQAYLTINPQPVAPNAPNVPPPPAPAAGSGCGNYFEFLSELSTGGSQGAVSLMVSLSGGLGGGMSSGGYDDRLCSTLVSLLVEAGLDPQAPQGGLDQAVIWLEQNPERLVDLAVEVDADFKPEPAQELDVKPVNRRSVAIPKGVFNPDPGEKTDYAGGKTPDYAIFARPVAPGGMKDNPSEVYAVFYVTPDNESGDYAAPGQSKGCDGPRRLSVVEHMRAWASLREAMRWIGTPGEILSSRECASGELAIAASYATAGDPSYADGPDEMVPAQLSVTFDNFENTAENRGYALERISLTLDKVLEGRDKSRVIFAPANAVAAAVRQDVKAGSTYVMDTSNGKLIATYRMSMPGDQ